MSYIKLQPGLWIKRLTASSIFTPGEWVCIAENDNGLITVKENSGGYCLIDPSNWDLTDIRKEKPIEKPGFFSRTIHEFAEGERRKRTIEFIKNHNIKINDDLADATCALIKQLTDFKGNLIMQNTENKTQLITQDNIVEVLTYNGFNASKMIPQILQIFGARRQSEHGPYYIPIDMTVSFECPKWLQIVETYTGKLKSLPVEESFEDWFEQNKLEGFSLTHSMNPDTQDYFITTPCPECSFCISGKWILQQQKDKCLQLMNIYKEQSCNYIKFK